MASILDQWRPVPVYNPNTLAFEMWDGSLRTGALTIGKVDQGAAGASAWLVDTEFPAAAALADSSANPTTTSVAALPFTYNSTGGTWSRQREATQFLTASGSGVGVSTVLLVGTRDDTLPYTPGEGTVGSARITSTRALHSAIRDSAGNDRGANVTAANALVVTPASDVGRSQVLASWEEMTGTAAVESALTNFTVGSRAASALSAASSLTVTTGKTLRIQTVSCYVKATSTVNNLARFRIRQAGTVANTSPVIFDAVLGLEVTGTIAAGAFHETTYAIPDGLEVAAGQQVAFTWNTDAITCTVGMAITGYEY